MAKKARKNKDPMKATKKGYEGYLDLSRKQLFELIEKKQEDIHKTQDEISDLSSDIDVLNNDIEQLIIVLREGADGEFVVHDDENLPRARKHIEELRKQADALEANLHETESSPEVRA